MTTKTAVTALVVGYILIHGTDVIARAECANTEASRTNAINKILEEAANDGGESVSSLLEEITSGNYELLEVRRSLSFNGTAKIDLSDFESTDFNG